MPDTREIQKIMQLQNLAGFEKFSKRTIAGELERSKFIELVEAAGDKALSQHIPLTADLIADFLIANGATIPVRCKDCKKWLKIEPSGTNCRYCAVSTRARLPYDFCSYGERRNNG